MPISQGTYTVPNNFVQQYDLGQKKIRADLVDENFTDAAGAINQLLTDDANTVHLTGAETISGNKTFTGSNSFSGTNAFSGTTTAVTQSASDNSTNVATTAYADNAASTAAAGVVVPSASSSTPAVRSASGAAGSSSAYARADHSHPNNWGSTTVAATSPAVVVETWHSGTEWYRVWSDGWIEQGGNTSGSGIKTVDLYKPFSDTNYSIFVSNYQDGGAGYNTIGVQSKQTTTSFDTFNVYSTGMWFACGY